ncbi:hypothetical protein ADUPG1_011540 [Aduncisulcus paluster]|uniref:Uncharacterized protein n=1 Tax=Aduncisulcus paluster TaxID=2918883 RepID=A0ABQ5JZX5_9EUKA|nr:hypothetical protein ADUPG1_011540 [Aduncisulcus paluster]
MTDISKELFQQVLEIEREAKQKELDYHKERQQRLLVEKDISDLNERIKELEGEQKTLIIELARSNQEKTELRKRIELETKRAADSLQQQKILKNHYDEEITKLSQKRAKFISDITSLRSQTTTIISQCNAEVTFLRQILSKHGIDEGSIVPSVCEMVGFVSGIKAKAQKDEDGEIAREKSSEASHQSPSHSHRQDEEKDEESDNQDNSQPFSPTIAHDSFVSGCEEETKVLDGSEKDTGNKLGPECPSESSIIQKQSPKAGYEEKDEESDNQDNSQPFSPTIAHDSFVSGCEEETKVLDGSEKDTGNKLGPECPSESSIIQKQSPKAGCSHDSSETTLKAHPSGSMSSDHSSSIPTLSPSSGVSLGAREKSSEASHQSPSHSHRQDEEKDEESDNQDNSQPFSPTIAHDSFVSGCEEETKVLDGSEKDTGNKLGPECPSESSIIQKQSPKAGCSHDSSETTLKAHPSGSMSSDHSSSIPTLSPSSGVSLGDSNTSKSFISDKSGEKEEEEENFNAISSSLATRDDEDAKAASIAEVGMIIKERDELRQYSSELYAQFSSLQTLSSALIDSYESVRICPHCEKEIHEGVEKLFEEVGENKENDQ